MIYDQIIIIIIIICWVYTVTKQNFTGYIINCITFVSIFVQINISTFLIACNQFPNKYYFLTVWTEILQDGQDCNIVILKWWAMHINQAIKVLIYHVLSLFMYSLIQVSYLYNYFEWVYLCFKLFLSQFSNRNIKN